MENEEELLDLENEVIELIDEDDNIIKFRFLDEIEYEGAKYAVLLPNEPNDAVEEDEVVIFRLSEDGTALEPVEDEGVLESVFELFQNGCDEDDEN